VTLREGLVLDLHKLGGLNFKLQDDIYSHIKSSLCMKYMSDTTDAPMPIPTEVPTPTNARAASRGPQEFATADPALTPNPIAVVIMYTGLRPYRLDIGEYIKGATPATTMVIVVL
jgi:hypothetical protein